MENLELKVQDHESRIKNLEERQDKFDDVIIAVSTLNTKLGYTDEKVDEIQKDVKTLVSKPAKMWDNVVEKVVLVVVGAVIAYLLTKVGL